MPPVRLHYHDLEPNFGDDLNPWLWHRLLPGCLDAAAPDQLVAIGTLLNRRLPSARRTLIFGAGVGYGPPPAVDSSWHFYFVRGPLSAQVLGLPRGLGLTDPAILLRTLPAPAATQRAARAYMPHVGELRWRPGVWQAVCAAVGVRFVDPRGSVDEIRLALAEIDTLYTEALHGAICADAMRVPWVAVRTSGRVLSFKWEDWCASMELPYRPVHLEGARLLLRQLGRSRLLAVIERDVLARRLERALAIGRPTLSRPEVLDKRTAAVSAKLAELAAELAK